jgi:integrase
MSRGLGDVYKRQPLEIKSLFEQHILPTLRGKQISEVSPTDLEKLFDEIGVKSRSTANKAYRWLNVMCNWAVRRDDLAKSPLRNVDIPFKEVSRDRVLDDHELALVWTATGELGYPFGPLIQLLLTTAQRRCEVAEMRWSEWEMQSREWTIPGSRTKNGKTHLVPLSALAIEVLSNIPRCAGHQSDFVFTTNGKTPSSGYSRAK